MKTDRRGFLTALAVAPLLPQLVPSPVGRLGDCLMSGGEMGSGLRSVTLHSDGSISDNATGELFRVTEDGIVLDRPRKMFVIMGQSQYRAMRSLAKDVGL